MPEEEAAHLRTEAPTPRRREQAREKGQVAVSQEFTGGLILLTGTAALWLGSGLLGGSLLYNTQRDLLQIHYSAFGVQQASNILSSVIVRGAQLAGALVALLFLVGLVASGLQAGFKVSFQPLQPDWSRVSLVRGWRRLFSAAAAMRGALAVAKVLVVVLVAAWVLRGRAFQISALGQSSLAVAASQAWDISIRMALAIAAAIVLIGLIDFAFQRWRFEQSLRMTRQELKEQLRQEEGDPHIRARIRKVQREISQKQMMDDVPRATVVVTNPTHLAVALQYERGKRPAPLVVAKGAGYVALRIVEIARRHSVPVVERRPLAQALYRAVAVGQEIPAALYHAVAELLTYVYRLRSSA